MVKNDSSGVFNFGSVLTNLAFEVRNISIEVTDLASEVMNIDFEATNIVSGVAMKNLSF